MNEVWSKLLEFLSATYRIALPIALGYIVWLLQTQKTSKKEDERRMAEEAIAQKKKENSQRDALKCLLRVQLIEYHDKYTERGSIPSYAYDNFDEMYHTYHELGGNGMVSKMKEEIDSLRLRTTKGE